MNLRDVLFGIGIMILTIFVTVYGMSVFYPSVEYDDFCGELRTREIIDSQQRCEEIGGKWSVYESVKPIEGGVDGFCDRDFNCRQEYDDASEVYSRNIFMVTIPLGIAIIALGALAFGLEVVGAGLMGGGVGTILYGVGGFWRFAQDWLKFLISLVGLVALIWLSCYFNKKFGKR